MQVSAIVSPSVFKEEALKQPGHRQGLIYFWKSIQSQTNILVDEKGTLWDDIEKAISELPVKFRQDFEIRVAEYRKSKVLKRKFVRCLDSVCGTAGSQSSEIRLDKLGKSMKPDGYFVSCLEDQKHPTTTVIGEIFESKFEKQKAAIENLGPIQGAPQLFDKMIERSVRFSKSIKFYDKQIGHGLNLRAFFHGVKHILSVWRNCAHFRPELVEIYSVGEYWSLETMVEELVGEAIEKNRLALQRIEESLLEPIRSSFPELNVKFIFKNDESRESHARYLETNTCVVLFERGFDIFRDDETLKCQELKLADASRQSLSRLRSLPPAIPDETP